MHFIIKSPRLLASFTAVLFIGTAASSCSGPAFVESSGANGGDRTGSKFDSSKPQSSDASADGTNKDGKNGKNGNGSDTLDQATKDRLQKLPKFGLLVNDLECGLCHVSIAGNVVSTRNVPPLWTTSDVEVSGNWFVNGDFHADTLSCASGQTAGCLGQNVSAKAAKGIHQQYSGPELPLDKSGDAKPDFPTIDFAAVEAHVVGRVATNQPSPLVVDKIYNGNLVLTGTKSDPIGLDRDVLVKGDLVIKGYYSGVGTIYVTGRIYIPADLRAVHSAFPYAADETAAASEADGKLLGTDALGLATSNSIFIADLGKQQNSDVGNETYTVYNHPYTPSNRSGTALGIDHVYSWFPGGAAGFAGMYEKAVSCETGNATQTGSFNMIEAFLYAQNTIAGISRRSSYTIRGGIIADYFHVVSGAMRCASAASSVHGRDQSRSYIEYDYRIRTGKLRILEFLADAFP